MTRRAPRLARACVCAYVCIFIKLHIPRNPALSSESFYATRIDPPRGGSMILVTKTYVCVCVYVCVYVCVCVCVYVCMYVYLLNCT